MNKAQKDAIELLRGLSKEEILEEFESMELNKHVIKDTQFFYYNTGDGGINEYKFIKEHNDWYEILFSKCYYNPNEQLEQLRYDTLRMKIVSRIRELNDGWIPDFETLNDKFFIYIWNNSYGSQICVGDAVSTQEQPLDMYLKSQALCKQLIKEMNDELIEYFTYQNWKWLEVDNDSV